MALTTIADLIFAGGIALAALTLAAAALHRAPTAMLAGSTLVEACAAVGVWVAFALRHDRPLAVAAGGLTACALVAGASLLLRRALRRVGAMDDRLAEAKTDLLAAVEREKSTLSAELELTLARARADSRSLLEEQERQIAEERRTLVAEREHDATKTLGEKLNHVQGQIEQRLAGWADDLDRTVYIRGEAFLVVESLNRLATHTAYHVGQIVLLAKHFAGPKWTSLSVPKGRSAEAKGEFKKGFIPAR